MSLLKFFNLNGIKHASKKHFCTSNYIYPSEKDGYTSEPMYPPIKDLRPKAVERDKVENWYKRIEQYPTVEEKLFCVNIPRYYGWKCLMLRENQIPYNVINFVKYITRTSIKDEPPTCYQSEKLNVNSLLSRIEDEILHQNSIKRNYDENMSDLDKEKHRATQLINTLHRILCSEVSHKSTSITDFEPRIEAFWSVGGIDPPESVINRRKSENISELNEPVNRWVQYLGLDTVLQYRSKNPLPCFWPRDSPGDVPVWTLEPENIGFQNEYRHGTSIPGFWPGEEHEFALLSYHLCNHINYRPPSYGKDDANEALLCQGILASFGWLTSLAAYQGFSPFSEITYPLTTQTILTDGQNFTIMAYQMNTNLVNGEHALNNPYKNLIWCSPTEPLFEKIENGKVLGVNELVVKRLLDVYLTAPEVRMGVNLKPYLGTDVKRIADYGDQDDEKRVWLEREFKHFSANRPRSRQDLIYEVYPWEKIYKIDHNTRPLDKKQRPFELRQRPFQRKMSDHCGGYIPKALRPDKDLPRYKQKKFYRTFYPE